MELLKVLQNEIDLIQDEEIREFVIKFLNEVPEYFWTIPASASGKYHPQYALGEGGLVRHVKATIMIANELLKLDVYKNLIGQKDYIIAALLLHDTYKHGQIDEGYTKPDHANLAYRALQNKHTGFKIQDIAWLVLTHMGQWNTDREGNVVAPTPTTEAQKFVHLCDYLASRKFLEVNFEE